MHNLHLVVVRSENGEDACNTVDSAIMEWGNENNWRTVSGSVSEDDEVHIEEEGRFSPNDESDTIEKINEMVNQWILGGNPLINLVISKTLDKLKKGEKLTSHEWWQIKEHAEHKRSAVNFEDEPFNVLEDSFKEWNLDENGVTNLLDDYEEEDGKIYVVFVDMHS